MNHSPRGQTMVELALVFPLAILVIIGIITLGIGVFYNQQVTNAAREAARYASIHSATAQCPTVSTRDPLISPADSYFRCDAPEEVNSDGSPNPWPAMTAAARERVFGLPAEDVVVVACWSGYVDPFTGSIDAPPPGTVTGIDSIWSQCTIDGADPTTSPGAIRCTADLFSRTLDTASDLSEAQGRVVANQVTAYACYEWAPPLAGFLLIPETVTLRAVLTQPIQRQQ